MSNRTVGRHRAPGSSNPVASLSSAVVRGARPAVAATATVAATGGIAIVGLTGTANAAQAAPNAPTAEAVVLSGDTSASVSYGAPVMATDEDHAQVEKDAKTTSFTAVTLSNRAKPAPQADEEAPSRSGGAIDTIGGNYNQAPASKGRNIPATGGVLGIAASLSGIPYVWGGTSTAGFDCSGYVQYVFRQAGISLPRTSGQMRASTTYISNPQPGDLVFFGDWHVGIYAGNGMMYDAPTAGQTTGLHKIWSSGVSYGRVG
ncbi:hypothetical protein KEM60_01744 [Austwickia sp. TVS 96-490-7B]|uniref:C40 family peptidase n=1 Tax=Austwickia sp. TVS 96-490-7B TaxID=2830843 RepID=UPI001C57381A|nr:C40 family peptidase [Austwickia sp. TVS 96-490-7B]MBW3085544.1 hypothetical protein [Austwickia sp. TVS 96-490-7B]